jgi:hypothetical protein
MKTLTYSRNTDQKDKTDKTVTVEKLRIYNEIKTYRKTHGLGSFKDISDATGGKITIHTIANMYTGTKVNSETWQEVGEALEKLREL